VAPSGGTASVSLNLNTAWGRAYRSADLGVADGTADDAGRLAAMRTYGIGTLSKKDLGALIRAAREISN
jgi:hypothetical protein